MKKTILFFSLFAITLFFAQKIDSVATLKQNDLTKDFFNDKKHTLKVGEFVLKDGNSIKVGDTVKIGKPSGIDYNIGYAGKKTSAYDNIIMGTPMGSLLKGLRYANTTEITDKEFKITQIRTALAMGNISVMAIMIPINFNLISDKYITVSKIDQSIANGEVILKNAKMTKEQAIKLLEEKKKLLDLGLIKQEDFEKLRDELKPIILN